MKFAVFGQSGQVATELRLQSGPHDLVSLGRDSADFSDPEAVAHTAASLKVDAVINAAAYTAVDKAESEPDLAHTVNGHAVGALARVCAEHNLPLVHISTDYVFDGTGTRPWHPDDATAPLGVYGASKRLGETEILASGARAAILRTSWVFSAHGNNFVKTMLRLGADRDRLTIVADQVGGPTPAREIARACLCLAEDLAKGHDGGTHHFSGQDNVSWADFAREIFAQAGLEVDVEDIPTSAYPTPAQRPANSRLDCTSLESAHGIQRPDWRAALSEMLKEIVE